MKILLTGAGGFIGSAINNKFCSKYNIIQAAGGVVFNDYNQLLMIFRNGKWDLPKGKLENFESVEQAAIREVEEECGVSNLKIDIRLDETYHIYTLQDKDILKKTYWFKMYCDNQFLIPQMEEGISKACWVPKDEIVEKLSNSYANIKDLLETNIL